MTPSRQHCHIPFQWSYCCTALINGAAAVTLCGRLTRLLQINVPSWPVHRAEDRARDPPLAAPHHLQPGGSPDDSPAEAAAAVAACLPACLGYSSTAAGWSGAHLRQDTHWQQHQNRKPCISSFNVKASQQPILKIDSRSKSLRIGSGGGEGLKRCI